MAEPPKETAQQRHDRLVGLCEEYLDEIDEVLTEPTGEDGVPPEPEEA